MKLLLLLVALACVTASAKLLSGKVYLQQGCNTSLYQVTKYPLELGGYRIELGCNNHQEVYVSGNLLKRRTWPFPNCSGIATNISILASLANLDIHSCTTRTEGFVNFTFMSEDDFGVYLNGRGNLVRKIWSSANCTGATDWIEVNPENTANLM